MKTFCKNCETELTGGFCPNCGQSGKDFDVPVGEFAKDFASETLSLDSRLRLTLSRLFFEPGGVASEYVVGHRARFVPPIRLYVFASFAMFFLLALGPDQAVNVTSSIGPTSSVEADASAIEVDPAQVAADAVGEPPEDAPAWVEDLQRRLQDAFDRTQEDPQSFLKLFRERFAQALFLLLPVLGMILKLAYPKRLYVQHLVFSIYLHSFVFLLMAALAFPSVVGLDRITVVTDFGLLWIPPYFYLGLRRFYDETRLRTLVKSALVSAVYLGLVGVTGLALLFVSLITF